MREGVPHRPRRFGNLAALLLAALAVPLHATTTFEATVNRSAITINETVLLQLTIEGDRLNVPRPTLPTLPGFRASSAGQSQSTQYVNGQLSSRVAYTYVLEPQAPGTYEIPALSLTVGDEVLRTEPITITVQAGRRAAPGAATAPAERAAQASPDEPDLFVETFVDKKDPFVGEPVVLTFRFVSYVPTVGNSQYQAPDTTGFIAEDLPPQRNDTQIRAGRRAQVAELRTLLYPITAGKVTIGPANLVCGVRVGGRNPFGDDSPFGDDFFSGVFGRVRQASLRSSPLTLHVRPLPAEGRPAGFKGDVGVYTLRAELDKSRVQQREPVTLTVTVSGEGNIKSLSAPALPPLNEFKAYETLSSVNISKEDGRQRGSKVFTTILKPEVSGVVTLPALSYSFFDPRAGAYRTVASTPLRLDVTPSTDVVSGFSPVAAAPGVRIVNEDIRFIKTQGDLRPHRRPWHRRPAAFAALQTAPGLVFLTTYGVLFLRRRGAADHRGRAFRRAEASAQRALRHAAAILHRGELDVYLEQLNRLNRRYWSDKTGRPAPGLTWDAVHGALPAGFDDTAARQAAQLWEELDMARFTPGLRTPAGAEDLGCRLSALWKDLERAWRRS